jgi:hypothetical protein
VAITKSGNDTWEEEGHGILTAVGTKIDENHDVKFGVLESFPDILGLESDFLVGGVFSKSHDTNLSFPTGKTLCNVRILLVRQFRGVNTSRMKRGASRLTITVKVPSGIS